MVHSDSLKRKCLSVMGRYDTHPAKPSTEAAPPGTTTVATFLTCDISGAVAEGKARCPGSVMVPPGACAQSGRRGAVVSGLGCRTVPGWCRNEEHSSAHPRSPERTLECCRLGSIWIQLGLSSGQSFLQLGTPVADAFEDSRMETAVQVRATVDDAPRGASSKIGGAHPLHARTLRHRIAVLA